MNRNYILNVTLKISAICFQRNPKGINFCFYFNTFKYLFSPPWMFNMDYSLQLQTNYQYPPNNDTRIALCTFLFQSFPFRWKVSILSVNSADFFSAHSKAFTVDSWPLTILINCINSAIRNKVLHDSMRTVKLQCMKEFWSSVEACF